MEEIKNEIVEKIQEINNYYIKDYKIIKNFLDKKYHLTNNNIFKDELNNLQDELINKSILNIDIVNKFYKTYIRSRITFDSLKTLPEKQKHMTYGQLIHYADKLLQGDIQQFDWIEFDKNIEQKNNVYYLKDTEIKLFEDIEVENEGVYYYACDENIALDTNSIQKLFSNTIMGLDYLSQAHYNDNRIFFFSGMQEDKYNFKIDLSNYKVFKRIYFVDTGFKEIYYIRENEIDIHCVLQNIVKKNNELEVCKLMKKSILDLRGVNNIEKINKVKEKFSDAIGEYEINFEKHLEVLENIKTEFHDDYIIVKNDEGINKIYKDNGRDRYFHGTGVNIAKAIIESGFKTDKDVTSFDFNKMFFSRGIDYAKFFGAMGGLDTTFEASGDYIVFECDLTEYGDRLYHYIHNAEYFVYSNKNIANTTIKRIWLIEDNVIQREITKDELLKMGVEHDSI